MITLKTTDPCILSANPLPMPPPDRTTFNVRYWLAQPTPIQAYSVSKMDQATAEDFASKGYVIDVQIMCWGWEPYDLMMWLIQRGYTWTPCVGQNTVPIAPGVNLPGNPQYDPNNPPVGAISVSLNFADYPPFVKVPPPAPAPTFIDLVGFPTGTLYNGLPMFTSAPKTDNSMVKPNGMFWNSRGEFQKIQTLSMFGTPVIFWVQVQSTGVL